MEQTFGTTICNFHYKHLARSIIEAMACVHLLCLCCTSSASVSNARVVSDEDNLRGAWARDDCKEWFIRAVLRSFCMMIDEGSGMLLMRRSQLKKLLFARCW